MTQPAARAEGPLRMDATSWQGPILVGIAELAELFSVRKTTVTKWHARQQTNGFPDPVVALSMGPVWDQAEVVAWWKGYTPIHRSIPKAGTLPEEYLK